MSKRGRKPNEMPREQVKFWMRLDLLAELRLWLMDPVSGKTKHGELTKYFEGLVEKDLAEKRRNAQTSTAQEQRKIAGPNDSNGVGAGALGQRTTGDPEGSVVPAVGEQRLGSEADSPPPHGTSVESTPKEVGSEGQDTEH